MQSDNCPRRQFSATLAALCVLPLLATTTRGQTPPPSATLVFGVISPRAATETRTRWEPFVKRLGAATRQPFELRIFEAQSALVKEFLAGLIDVAWMGNVPALEVVEANAGEVFAQMITKDGNTGYSSLLVVHKQSPIKTLGDVLKSASSLRFADGDTRSTSGYLVPLYFAFSKSGVNNTKAIFKSVEVGNHQVNLTRVAQGAVDVATANSEELAFFQHDYPELAKNLSAVWASPLIPQSPLLWKFGMQPELKRAIRKFVTTFGDADPEEKRILLAVNGLSRFRPSSNRQLVPIADLEMFKSRQAINNDKTLSDSERLSRIEQTIARGSRLELRLKLIPQ